MPKIQLSVAHNLGQEEAQRRAVKLISETREQFGGKVTDLDESWNGNIETFSFRALGFAVSGKMEVQPASLEIEINLPMAAMLFKSRVENEILTHAKSVLA